MWIDVKQGRLYAEITGRGPPLLTVHGWPLDHRIFQPQVHTLSSTLTVIAYDRRGFGRSEAPPGLHLESDDINRILDALELPSVHLLGMSQGGRIALRYAVTHGHRLRSLILQSAVIDGLNVDEAEDEHIPIACYARLAQQDRVDEVRRRWREHPMMQLPAGFESEEKLLDHILADYTGADLKNIDRGRSNSSVDVLAALETLDLPALILSGARDTAARRQHADVVRSRVAGCEAVELESSGHLANLTEPERYNRAILEFCERIEAARESL